MDDKGRLLHPREIAALCYSAGWTDADKLLIAVSVCLAEGNGYEHAKHVNDDVVKDAQGNVITPASIDRGLWQINDRAHPTVSDDAAYNARRATLIARGVYLARGSTFNAWSAYQNGSYKSPQAMGYAAPGIGNFLLEKHGMLPPGL